MARVTAAPGSRWDGRVIGGYLYYASDGPPAGTRPRSDASAERAVGEGSDGSAGGGGTGTSPGCDGGLEPEAALHRLEQLLTRVEAAPDLSTAVDHFVKLVLQYQRSAAQARARLARLRRQAEAAGTPLELPPLRTGADALLERIRQAARGSRDPRAALARCLADPTLAGLSPAWDVAVPTFAEAPALLEAALQRARETGPSTRQRARSPAATGAPAGAPAPSGATEAREQARQAARLLENDDLIFARAQAVLRRQALAIGQRLAACGNLRQPDDVFFLDLDEIVAVQALHSPAHRRRTASVGVGALVARRRRQLQAARALAPPLTIVEGRPEPEGPAPALLRGHGVGQGRRVGRARILLHLDELPAGGAAGEGEVVVVPALLAHAVHLLLGARAVVTDHGGALSHAATLAREVGLPAVLGTGVATRRLRPGQLVVVDADRGTVLPL